MKKLVTALFLILATAVWAGDYEDGSAALRKGDFEAAANHFKRAAIGGDPKSQYNLGLMYERGDGVDQDFAQATHLYKQAAAQGHAAAQYNSGLMYANGKGVLQDYAEAVRLFKLAAEKGISVAQFNLGVMYHLGKGVLQDYLQAHMWMNLAAVSGYKDAPKARDVIAAKMTSQQIGKAQAMAKNCLASNYKDCE